MRDKQIKNFEDLATTENRRDALAIMEAGLKSINTENVILNSVRLQDDVLSIMGESFVLSKYKNIKIVGFGKSSCEGAIALEKILGDKIKEGVVIGLSKVICDNIEIFAGTHPRPSEANVEAGKKIYEIAKNSTEDDLIIALVSGGGSALLCYGDEECVQGVKLYDAFLNSGKTITEMNTVRKHLSLLKGGGLAKIAYPATVIGLIFSDVPGDNFADVASGPTYKDVTTIADAEKIIAKNNLGEFKLIETPKEDKYFEKVHNFVLVSNTTAAQAMAEKGKELGLATKIVSTELYDKGDDAIQKIFNAKGENTLVLAAGEPKIEVKDKSGKGGRNTHLSLQVLNNKIIDENSVFISFASDGQDNSDVAGAVVDKNTIEKAQKLNLNSEEYLNNFDSYNFFAKTGDLIITGPTGANVSDLMVLLTKKP
ncbi:MAG: DUF4147 domain-containing protein [Candidatus Paceibacterota bacterium]